MTSMLKEYKCRVHDLSVELHSDAIGDISDKLKNMGSKSMNFCRIPEEIWTVDQFSV